MKHFEFNGEFYKQASKHQKEWGTKLISELTLKGDEHILDLGCGDGVLTEQLSELVPEGKAIGIDASIGMIQSAQKLESANLSFICLNINDIKFVNCFDVIFSNAALHWVENHQKILENSMIALKPNGVILWNFAADGNCSNFFDAIKTVMNMPLYKNFFTEFTWPWYMPTKEEYTNLVDNAGFKHFNVLDENADRYFQNNEEMIKWIDQPSLVPFIQHIPSHKKDGFRKTVIEMMINKTKQPDGRCFETFRRIYVKAIK